MKLNRHKFLARKERKLYVYQIIRFLHTDAYTYTNMYGIISADMQNAHIHICTYVLLYRISSLSLSFISKK